MDEAQRGSRGRNPRGKEYQMAGTDSQNSYISLFHYSSLPVVVSGIFGLSVCVLDVLFCFVSE